MLEKAFADHNGPEGKDRKAMTGRGSFNQVKQKIKAEGGEGLDDTIESVELHLRAELYGTQGRRLQHTIDRLAGIENRTLSMQHRNTLITQNKNTMKVILGKRIDANEVQEEEMLRMMRVAPLDAAAVGATYRRAHDWYTKMQAKTKELAEAKKPRPVDPKLKGFKAGLAKAEQPLMIDPKLAELRRARDLSEKQQGTIRLTAAQDIVWALINSPAFLFNR